MVKAQLYLLGYENAKNSNTQMACIFDDLETMLQIDKKMALGCVRFLDIKCFTALVGAPKLPTTK